MKNARGCWIRAQQVDSAEGSAATAPEIALEIKEWEATKLEEEIASAQGIKIRKRAPTGPPLNYVGPLELGFPNEDKSPRNILEEIVWYKDKELKEEKPLHSVKKTLDSAPPARDFLGALKASYLRTGMPGLIAEVKKASPSRGILRENFNPVEIAKMYEKGGAACLSVLTDEKFFKGSFGNLEAIRKAEVKHQPFMPCPLLCKEFIIDIWQIFYARSKGVDAILLIAAVLPDHDIRYMTKICKTLGLAAIIEMHDKREMDRVLGLEGVEIIGINNRNLGTFEVDINNTKKLLYGVRGQKMSEKDIIVVSESCLFTPYDIAVVQEAGCRAVLVGESLVKRDNLGQGIAELFGKDISQ